MKKLKLLTTILFALASNLLFAQSSEIIKKYIETYKDIAIAEEMRTGVPASITLAQGIHETGAGSSHLVLKSNNHFGIKCKTEWNGQKVYHDDDARGECFRKYNDPIDSYKDHSDFLKTRSHYASLFKLDPLDYKGWAYGLKEAGYATNPKYPQILIKLIEDYNLQQYTLIALNSKGERNELVYASNTGEKEVESNMVVLKESEVDLDVVKVVNYPPGVFKINETKVIYVSKGTAFLKIAEENNLSLARLFEFNDMTPTDIAEKEQLIFLQRKRTVGSEEFHVVQKGESLYDISQMQGIRLESLLSYNLLAKNMQPAVGEKLNLKWKASRMPALQHPEANKIAFVRKPTIRVDANTFTLHTVQPKETLYAIAKKYSVTVEEVMGWNELESGDLKMGQQLRIKKISNAGN